MAVAFGIGTAGAHGIHDIGIAMSAPATVMVGERFTYNIDVRNGGLGDPAYGIVATQILPPDVVFVEADGGPFRCTYARAKSTLTCSAEQIPFAVTTIAVAVTAQHSAPQVVSTAKVESVGTIDSSPTNNTASATTKVFDPVACQAATPHLLRPEKDAAVRSPVTLQWASGLSFATYRVYVARKGETAQLVATTGEASAVVDLPAGPMEWYVEAVSDSCLPLTSATSAFSSLGNTPPQRRRAAGR